jgi:hypothetical protein
VHRHAARRAVDREWPRSEPLAQSRLRPPQNRVDPRDELLVVERPRDEVVAAAFEGVDAVDGVIAGVAEDDQRHVAVPATSGLALSQHAADLERRRVRETADEHEVRPLALHQLERLASAVRAEDREAVAHQVPLQELARSGLGLRQQQRLRHGNRR